jgi:hypothetical protein
MKKDAADASTKRPPDEGATSINTNEVLMLHSRLKIMQSRAAQANKAALETEKAGTCFTTKYSRSKNRFNQREYALMMMLVILMKFSQKLIIGT